MSEGLRSRGNPSAANGPRHRPLPLGSDDWEGSLRRAWSPHDSRCASHGAVPRIENQSSVDVDSAARAGENAVSDFNFQRATFLQAQRVRPGRDLSGGLPHQIAQTKENALQDVAAIQRAADQVDDRDDVISEFRRGVRRAIVDVHSDSHDASAVGDGFDERSTEFAASDEHIVRPAYSERKAWGHQGACGVANGDPGR